MRPEHWKEIEALYHALASEDAERRSIILARARDANPELCREVESLLALASDADRILPEAPQVRQLLESPGWQAAGAMFQAEDVLGERFRIVRLIGIGGMGEVYEAEDVVLKESVALKTIRPGIVERAEMPTRFAREVLAAKRISHPNICRIHDLHRHLPPNTAGPEIVFLTMELLVGRTLGEFLRSVGPMSLAEAEPVVQQISSALTAAHRAGVIHRDLKPENVILTTGPDGRVRAVVTDFGLAGTHEGDRLTSPGVITGTPAYMAPEQLIGGSVTSAADIYAFGLVLFEMLTGKFPFTGPSPVAIAAERLQAAPLSPRTYIPNLPAEWECAILGCLEREPANRFQNVSDVWETIAARSTRAPQAGGSTRWRLLRTRTTAFIASVFAITIAGGVVARSRLTNSTLGVTSDSHVVYMAVLPFRSLDKDPRPRYQAEGITEALAGKLFPLHDIHLASRSAVDGVKSDDPLKISRALGVRFLVSGSVRNATNGNITVVATLEEPEKKRALWTGQFAGASQDLLTIEDRIYSGLIQALHLPPAKDEPNRGTAHPTENLEAYDLYLQGRATFRQQSDVASGIAAVAQFTMAIEKDPNFGLAYAGMADACMYIYDQKRDRIWLDKALYAAQQAIRRSPDMPEPHIALGGVYRQTGRHAEAVRELERALALAPGSDAAARRLASVYKDRGDKPESMRYYAAAIDSNPYYWKNYSELGRAQVHFAEYRPAIESFSKVTELAPDIATGYLDLGAVYFHQGKCEQAIPQFQKATQVTPSMYAYANLSACYYSLYRFEEAVQAGELAVKLDPGVEWAMGNLADAYRWSGRSEKANATYDRAIMLSYKELATNPKDAALLGRLALYYEKDGKQEEAFRFMTKARELDGERPEILFNQSILESLAGNQSAALRHLREAVEQGYEIAQIDHEPELQSLRKLPEYRALMRGPRAAGKP
jgi:serine/threonine protein kinase/Flp pilus assembly protein TadD